MRFYLLFFVLCSSCFKLPDLYVIDRPSIMEMESSADWEVLGDDELLRTPSQSPMEKKGEVTSGVKTSAFSILKSELSSNQMERHSAKTRVQ